MSVGGPDAAPDAVPDGGPDGGPAPGRFRWLTPPGAAALAGLVLGWDPACLGAARLPELGAGGRARTWPAPGRVRVAWLLDGPDLVDEVVVVGRCRGYELYAHGGGGIRLALDRLLAARDWRPEAPRRSPDVSGPRAARAWASAHWGVLRERAELARDVLSRAAVGAPVAGLDGARRLLDEVLERALLARRLRTPAVVRIVGLENAGKSTLFNALLDEERALVSPVPGTTRDPVRATMLLADVAIVLEDTAGVAGAPLPVRGADAVIHLLTTPEEPSISTPGRVPVLEVLGRADERPRPGADAVSGRTGAGLERLMERLGVVLGLTGGPEDDVRAPVDPSQARRILVARRALS